MMARTACAPRTGCMGLMLTMVTLEYLRMTSRCFHVVLERSDSRTQF
jgi:hypothetical protein